MHPAKTIAVIVAGGKGRRMQSHIKKQYLKLENIPVLTRTLLAFDTHDRVDDIILVLPRSDMATAVDDIIRPYGIQSEVHLVRGGQTRQDSVSHGLDKAVPLARAPERDLVLVHDGVRPFVTPQLMSDLLDLARDKGGAIPILPLTDTVKTIDADGRVARTVDRNRIFRVQTPQVFRLDLLRNAFAHALKTGFTGTDDASVAEHAGYPVFTLPGSPFNIKLTTPEDLVLARHILEHL